MAEAVEPGQDPASYMMDHATGQIEELHFEPELGQIPIATIEFPNPLQSEIQQTFKAPYSQPLTPSPAPMACGYQGSDLSSLPNTNSMYCYQHGSGSYILNDQNTVIGPYGSGITSYIPMYYMTNEANFAAVRSPLSSYELQPNYNYQPREGFTTNTTQVQQQRRHNVHRRNKEECAELRVISDEGKNRLFPHEPELSPSFKDYLHMLNKQDAEFIKSLAKNPPLMQQTTNEWPKKKSYCYITTDDINEVQAEIVRIVNSWDDEQRRAVTKHGYKSDSSIELLSLHEYLVSHILAAKERCINKALETSQDKKRHEPVFTLDASKTKEVGYNLFWQTRVFMDLYRQTLMTPFMADKRQQKIESASSAVAATGRKRRLPGALNNDNKKKTATTQKVPITHPSPHPIIDLS